MQENQLYPTTVSFNAYAKAALAFFITSGAFLLSKTGLLPEWLSEEQSTGEEDANKVASSERSLAQTFALSDIKAPDLSGTHHSHERRALSNETQSTLIQGTLAGTFNTAASAQAIFIQNNYALLAEGNAGLQIVDISNASNPQWVSSYDTPGFAHQVKISGNYAYVADDTAGLRILNITDIENPSLVGVYMVLGNRLNDNTLTAVTQVAVANNKAYLTDYSTGRLEVIDVSEPPHVISIHLTVAETMNEGTSFSLSNNTVCIASAVGFVTYNVSDPLNPTLLATYAASWNVIGVSVIAEIAYIATSDNLQVFNVSSATPVLLSNITVAAGSYITAMEVGIGGYGADAPVVYLGLVSSSSSSLQSIIMSDPTAPMELGAVSTDDAYVSLYNVGTVLYAGAEQSMQIIDVSAYPPIFLGSYTITDLGTLNNIFVLETTAYLAASSGILLVDVTNLLNPSLINTYPTGVGISVSSIVVLGTTAYIGIDDILELIDVTNKTNLLFLADYSTDSIIKGVQVSGNLAYAATFNGVVGLHVIDVSQPTKSLFGVQYIDNGQITDIAQSDGYLYFSHLQPNVGFTVVDASNFVIPGYFNVPLNAATAVALNVFGAIAYVTDGNSLKIIDITNTTTPALMGIYNVSGGVQGVSVAVGTAYLATGYGFEILDVSDLSNPTLLATYNISGGANAVAVSGNTLYLGTNTNLLAFDISNPAVPLLVGTYAINPTNLGVGVSTIEVGMLSVSQGIACIAGNLFDVTYPATPIEISMGTCGGAGAASSFLGTDVYSTNQFDAPAVGITDTTNLATPTLLGTYIYPITATLKSISVFQNMSYVLSAVHNGIYTLSTHLEQAHLPMAQSALHAAYANNYTYVADIQKVVHVIDVSNASMPIEVATYTLSNFAQDMMVVGDFLYVAEGASGVEVVDVSNPLMPLRSGTINTGISNAQSLYAVNNQFLYVGDLRNGFLIFNIPEKIVIVDNQLTINQGQLANITLNDVSARDTRQQGFYPPLVFSVSNITHGQFELTGTAMPITQFTQQQIIDGNIQFQHDGSGFPPSYLLIATNGVVTTAPMSASITFHRIEQPPVLVNNTLVINQGEALTLTTSNIGATSTSINNALLQFTVNNIANGRFQSMAAPDVIITQFIQEQIMNGTIQFVQLGGGRNKPSYQISVSDGILSTPFVNGIINFDAAPEIITNQLTINNGETVEFTSQNLEAIDIDSDNATLLFEISDLQHGKFEAVQNGTVFLNTTGGVMVSFRQEDITDGLIRFVHDGSGHAPSYIVGVSDGRIFVGNQTATVVFNTINNSTSSGNSGTNTGAIVGGVIGGVVGLAGLLAGAGLFAKNYNDRSTREKHLFAAYVRNALGLRDVDNFETDKGQRYVSAINDLMNVLKQQGLDFTRMTEKDLKVLAQEVATVAKSKITADTTFFGYSAITIDDLTDKKISEIALGVINLRSQQSPEGIVIGDDTNILMTELK